MAATSSGPGRPRPHSQFFDLYTQGLTTEDLQRLFTRDAREAYRFFARGIDPTTLAGLPWHRRLAAQARLFFLAFTLKLSPARRVVFAVALVAALIGVVKLFRGVTTISVPVAGFLLQVPMITPRWEEGTTALLLAFLLMNLLVLLEVADRLTLKNDLEVARDIQQAMLPAGTYRADGVEAFGFTRPANTVGGDFYEILPLPDGRIIVALGDVAGKGSPAALLMALLLAMLRTLVDAGLEPIELIERLNVQIVKHAPASRFITLFLAFYHPATGELAHINAGQTPPLLRRRSGEFERLTDGGIALGMFDASRYRLGRVWLGPGDLLVLYSDGITEAEDPQGRPLEETGLQQAITDGCDLPAGELGQAIVGTVERHARDKRFADDLTVVVLRRPA